MTIENGWLTAMEINHLFLADVSRDTAFRFAKDLDKFLSRERRSDHEGRGVKPLEFHYLALPLEMIVAFENRFRPCQPGKDKGEARGKTSLLETGEAGKVYAFIRKMLLLEPDISAAEMRRRCLLQFGPIFNAGKIVDGTQPRVPMPPLRTFQAFMVRLKARSTPSQETEPAPSL